MKKIMRFTLLVAFGLGVFNSYAQEIDTKVVRKNVINLNLSSTLVSHFGISYERVLSNRNSLRLYGDIAYLNYRADDSNIKVNGFGIVPEFRHYVGKKGAPNSYFIGVYAPLRRYELAGDINEDNKVFKGSGTVSYLGFGFVNGPQWLLGNRISLSIPFGISFGGASVKGDYRYVDPSTNTVEVKKADIPLLGASLMPRFAIELGVAF